MPPISRIYKGTELVYQSPEVQPLTAFITGLVAGDRIELFRSANIRTSEEISTATLKGVNPHGARGTIRGGPRTGILNSIWYDIDFDTGFDGWCVSDNYVKIASTAVQTTPSYFKVGDRVRLFRAANSRSSAAIATNLLGVVPKDAVGVITAGPTKNGTINWYNINFDTGFDGWCASDNFVVVTATSPTGPTGPAGPLPPIPGDDAIRQAIGTDYTEYDTTFGVGSTNGYTGLRDTSDSHCSAVYALAALKGVTTSYSGRIPKDRLIGQLKHWAANRLPGGSGGFTAKFEIGFVSTVVIAWLMPDVRNALTAREQARIDLAMKACLIGSAWDVATGNTYGQASSKSRSIRGFTAWRTNPNFSLPPLFIPHLVAGYMGRTNAQNFMQNFNRDTFAAQIAAQFPEFISGNSYSSNNARVDMWDTFRQDWRGGGSTIGPGPTKAQLETALRNWTDYKERASILNPTPVIVGQIERMWSKVIRPGLTPDGNNQSPNEPWGVWNNAKSIYAGRIVDRSRWAGLPNQGLVGAAFELDSGDAGSDSFSNESTKRSGMDYVYDGVTSLMQALAAFSCQSDINMKSAAFNEGRTRMARGMQDLRYKLDGSGYQSYAKGGEGTNNSIWNWSTRSTSERLLAIHGLYDDTILPFMRP